MKKQPFFTVAILLAVAVTFLPGQTLDDFIEKAVLFQKSGNLDQAIRTMAQARVKYPGNSIVHSYLGLFKGMQAGKTENYMDAFQMVTESFELLDRAVSLDPEHPLPRLHRGLMGVNVPEFLGKLDQGIRDLELLFKWGQEPSRKISMDILIQGIKFLARGYEKKKEVQKAIDLWKKLVQLNPEKEVISEAEKEIEKLQRMMPEGTPVETKPASQRINHLKEKIKQDLDNPDLLCDLGQAYLANKNFQEARKIFNRVIQLDSKNLQAYKLLAAVLSELASRGYDQHVYHNPNYRADLAFELSTILDKACELAPDDIELRLHRGISGIEMPFFVKKLDQGISDLNWILKSQADYETKAEAHFWLGRAYQKKAMGYWIKVVSDYSKSKAFGEVFDRLHPRIKHLDTAGLRLPAVTIDFIIGFQDELAPQTAIWIENKKGDFIKTIYVSGFSGYAKEQQINLSSWADASDFVDVDGVTGASINLGHHIYIWDLKDRKGNAVKSGEYVVKVEVAFWPSMEYQLISTVINVGRGQTSSLKKEGNLVPYLEVKYYTEDKK